MKCELNVSQNIFILRSKGSSLNPLLPHLVLADTAIIGRCCYYMYYNIISSSNIIIIISSFDINILLSSGFRIYSARRHSGPEMDPLEYF